MNDKELFDEEDINEDPELYLDVTEEADNELLNEITESFTRDLIGNSPFSSEEWTENNYRPREW